METNVSSGKKTCSKAIILECLILVVGGFLLALAANYLSPRGLALTENHFRLLTNVSTIVPTNSTTLGSNAVPSAIDQMAAKLRAVGLQLALSNQVIQLYHDPRYQMEQVIFVDARDDKSYTEGHIPGAYQLDHYHKDKFQKYLATLLPVCAMAEQIILYCNGGDCEDSQFAATDLSDGRIGREKLFIYAGGINEWMSNAMPVEIGARKSGILKTNTVPSASSGGAKL